MTLQWRELTPEEVAALDAQVPPPDVIARQEWDKKHPRCEECGQFVSGHGHFFRDYWGEVHHE